MVHMPLWTIGKRDGWLLLVIVVLVVSVVVVQSSDSSKRDCFYSF